MKSYHTYINVSLPLLIDYLFLIPLHGKNEIFLDHNLPPSQPDIVEKFMSQPFCNSKTTFRLDLRYL